MTGMHAHASIVGNPYVLVAPRKAGRRGVGKIAASLFADRRKRNIPLGKDRRDRSAGHSDRLARGAAVSPETAGRNCSQSYREALGLGRTRSGR